MKQLILFTLLLAFTFSACSKDEGAGGGTSPGGSSDKGVALLTDKACYLPGEPVNFTLDKEMSDINGEVYVRYRHLAEVIATAPLTGRQWSWTPPATDFRGYMADVFQKNGDKEKVLGTIAVDVSSDWTRFPRYGFLSKYDTMTDEQIEAVIGNLSRHHINGVQFQDWHYKHHKPLAGTPEAPDATWKDINSRNTSLATVKGYIAATHRYGMKSIFYNLCFGALKDAASDGVQEEWYLFKDRNHQQKDLHDLPKPFFWSDIYLTNPGNPEWQQYLVRQNSDVYRVFDFDGYQIDQLGSRGTNYDYSGASVDLPSGYGSFIAAMKQAHPDKRLVMNAVSQYGQEQIARGSVDFLYNEVWGDSPKFTDLVRILQENEAYSNGRLQTVFAAYMNYNVADNKGFFNTPGVLLTDAVMFAFGASHLELGEHMLGKEYFPNNNLEMKSDLKKGLVCYYDFLTAYQNLLRDGGKLNNVEVNCTNSRMNLAAWPPQGGKVATVSRLVDNRQVVHLLNLASANYFDWRDVDGTMPEPTLVTDAALQLRTTRKVNKLWVASPDRNGGAVQELTFTQNAASISFKLPSLKYWTMVVAEY